MEIIKPPKLEDLSYGMQLNAAVGKSQIIADMDFETYSEAGFVWNEQFKKWGCLPNAHKKGLPIVGVMPYTQHPTAEVLCLAYNLKDGFGSRLWKPGDEVPFDLFEHLRRGKLIEAWNCFFEYSVWNNICVPKYGFPPLNYLFLRDAMAKSRAFGLPGSLDATGKILNCVNLKDALGKKLLQKFSIPRNPTRMDPRKRILANDADPDTKSLWLYNIKDINAEAEISSKIPDLNKEELNYWQHDLAINIKGVKIDIDAINSAIELIELTSKEYNETLSEITNGEVKSAFEIKRIIHWLNKNYNIRITTLENESLKNLLEDPNLPPDVKTVLQIRQSLAYASVKKLYAMRNQVCKDGRLHDLFIYHSARTGRAAGAGPQPQNLPNSGPEVAKCNSCNKYHVHQGFDCPWCGCSVGKLMEWNRHAMEEAIDLLKLKSLHSFKFVWHEPLPVISACLRGMFIASPGYDLICSDYSAIEAVVLAALAKEQWRLDVFKTHGKIYEMSASKITGIPFEEFEEYKIRNNSHHPLRKKVGKVAELASGYQGWIGAWKQFGADEFFSDDEIKQSILAWRKASPNIVAMWGGQKKYGQENFYGLEGCAIMAVMNPRTEYNFNGLSYFVQQDILYCRLLSGRYIVYHQPRLAYDPNRGTQQLTFAGWNTNPKNGPMGWIRMSTYGGKLTENIVQATARDILMNAIINLEKIGYEVVLHVHDEIVAEIRECHGSIEIFEETMSQLPTWAADWPIKASGGWRAKRYSK